MQFLASQHSTEILQTEIDSVTFPTPVKLELQIFPIKLKLYYPIPITVQYI